MDAEQRYDAANLSSVGNYSASTNSSYNETFVPRTNAEINTIMVLLILVFFLTLVINTAMLGALLFFHKRHTLKGSPFEVLVLFLVVADLLVLIPLVFSIHAVMTNLTAVEHSFTRVLNCSLDHALQVVMMSLLAAISYQRYRSTVNSFRYPGSRMTHRQSLIIGAGSLILGVILFLCYIFTLSRVDYSYWGTTFIVAGNTNVKWPVILYLVLLGVGVFVVIVSTALLMYTVCRLKHLPQRSSMGRFGTPSPSPPPQRLEVMEQVVVFPQKPLPAAHSWPSFISGASALGKLEDRKVKGHSFHEDSQHQPAEKRDEGASGAAMWPRIEGSNLTRRPLHPALEQDRDNESSQPFLALPPQAPGPESRGHQGSRKGGHWHENRRGDSHLKACIKLWALLLSAVFVIPQICLNVLRVWNGLWFEPRWLLMVARLLFYLDAFLSPLALLQLALFEALPRCICWRCRLFPAKDLDKHPFVIKLALMDNVQDD